MGVLGARRCAAALLVGVALTSLYAAPPVGAVADDVSSGSGIEPDEYGPVAPGTYRAPVARVVSDPFRMDAGLYGPGNRGLEYVGVPGDAVWAFGSGLVVFAGPVAGRLAVTLRHPDGRRSSLTGLVALTVTRGQMVVRGQLVGRAGEQLHLGLREGDRYVDPALFLTTSRRRAVLVPLGEPGSG